MASDDDLLWDELIQILQEEHERLPVRMTEDEARAYLDSLTMEQRGVLQWKQSQIRGGNSEFLGEGVSKRERKRLTAENRDSALREALDANGDNGIVALAEWAKTELLLLDTPRPSKTDAELDAEDAAMEERHRKAGLEKDRQDRYRAKLPESRKELIKAQKRVRDSERTLASLEARLADLIRRRDDPNLHPVLDVRSTNGQIKTFTQTLEQSRATLAKNRRLLAEAEAAVLRETTD
jgi:hypothetical protein